MDHVKSWSGIDFFIGRQIFSFVFEVIGNFLETEDNFCGNSRNFMKTVSEKSPIGNTRILLVLVMEIAKLSEKGRDYAIT